MSKRKSDVVNQVRTFRPEIEATAGPMATDAPNVVSLPDEVREQKIAEAAYFRAEKRGFAPGNELDDWIAAEADLAGVSSQDAAELH